MIKRAKAAAVLTMASALCASLSLAFSLVGTTPAAAVEAAERAVSDRAEARLMVDKTVAAPGSTVTAALQLMLAPHWHSYWINPGASGLETTVTWDAPEGVEIGPLQFPTPKRIPFGELVNFGFEGEAVHLAEISIPSDWPAAAPLALRAKADWLVCNDICLPESQEFTLTLPVADSAETDFAAALVVARGRAAQPPDTGAPARHETLDDGRLRIEIDSSVLAEAGLSNHFFFPVDWRAAQPSAPQQMARTAAGIALTIEPADVGFASPVKGVLRAEDASGAPVAIFVTAREGQASAAAIGPAADAPGASGGGTPNAQAAAAAAGPGLSAATRPALGLGLSESLAAAALLAFLGGLILNLMPCVFPVLALKAMAIANSAHRSGGQADLGHGLAYGAGVLISFLVFAGGLIALKAAGVAAGWGFQLQTPIVVAALAYVLVLVGLNLSGVFEIAPRFAGAGQGLTERGGSAGSFFTGVLAAVVAAPCTAPFMGAALGYALTQNAAAALVVFAALGLGFAAPIVALSAAPGVARLVPKPGPWMIRFRQALAFPMYLAAAWLFWVLGNQAGVDALFAALAGAVLIGFAAWALGAGFPESRPARLAAMGTAALAIVGALWALSPSLSGRPGLDGGAARAAASPGAAPARAELGEPYAPARLAALREADRTVFLNVTADWCISCKVNELNVLSGERFEATLAAADAVYLKGDWTVRDEMVTALLAEFGRVGVPLYVVYPRGGEAPIILPQILSHGVLEQALAAG